MTSPTTLSRSAEQASRGASSYSGAWPIWPPQKWLRIFEWVLLTLLFVQIGMRAAPRAWHKLNSDFPSYYLTARLAREQYDTTRIYEWIWLQRQKDHRAIDQRTIGMVPSTAFSTLAVYPLASMPPLKAKHCWLILNLALLLATLFLIRSLTMLSWRRVLLIAALSGPLRANFLLGQYYVLLLFLLTLACWLYLRQRQFMAGLMVGLAAGLKIFPVIYLLFFLRKRDWRALAGGVVASLGSLAVSIRLFGWELNQTYIAQVLPATLRGETLGPYNLQAESLSSLLHRLFIFEPQLNPHPLANIPWLFAVLHPLLQLALVAPAILLVVPGDNHPRRVQLEWSAILLASLAISTSPGSYLFTLLILPAACLWASLQEKPEYLPPALLLSLYVAAGSLAGKSNGGEGWAAVVAVPRLYALILLAVFSYLVLFRLEPHKETRHGRVRWAFALIAIMLLGIATNLKHLRGLYADYRWRIPQSAGTLMEASPAIQDNAMLFIALLSDGYHSALAHSNTINFSPASDEDYLALTAVSGEHWIEQTGKESTLKSSLPGKDDIRNAESPVASPNGRWLAFLREDHGRANIWLRDFNQPDNPDRLITPPELNVLEMSFLPEGGLVFAANSEGHSALFITDQLGKISSLDLANTRYPAVSPDGRWLAYSQLESGNWNLWLRNLSSGHAERLTRAECNDTESVWAEDSRTLLYASDCGRGLWLSAICRRRVVQ